MRKDTYRNRHGRRWGRGARPYLIMLKLIGVAAFLGGLAGVLVIVLAQPAPPTAAGWEMRVAQLRRAFLWLIIPGSTLASLAGLALLASVWQALIRMRWFQVKLTLIVIGLPCLHLYLRDRLMTLAEMSQAGKPPGTTGLAMVDGDLLRGVAAGIALGLGIACLGRVKPRLWQNYGRTFGSKSTPGGNAPAKSPD